MVKDVGFKVVVYMMLDFFNVGWERDVEQFIVSDIVKGDNFIKCVDYQIINIKI